MELYIIYELYKDDASKEFIKRVVMITDNKEIYEKCKNTIYFIIEKITLNKMIEYNS